LKCEARKIKQILVNLLTNAIKYSPARTTINITTQKLNDKIIIAVQDQGFGIKQTDIAKILKRYQVVKNINSGKVDSFGLGLPLIKYLIELHQGELKIESEPDQGSKFIIILPCDSIN
jgi:signal transduction histidine kinase